MKIEYRKVGDYCMPNLTIQEKLKRNRLGKNSSLRREHLKQNKKRKLRELIYINKFNKRQNDVQVNCRNLRKKLNEEYKKKDNITEELKTKNQIELLRRMNTISKIIDKYILKECAYKDKI
jgi:hypothetical protein